MYIHIYIYIYSFIYKYIIYFLDFSKHIKTYVQISSYIQLFTQHLIQTSKASAYKQKTHPKHQITCSNFIFFKNPYFPNLSIQTNQSFMLNCRALFILYIFFIF